MSKVFFVVIGAGLAALYAFYSYDIFMYFYGTGMTRPIRWSLVPQIAIFPLYMSLAIPKIFSSGEEEYDQAFPVVFILGVALSSLSLIAFVIDVLNTKEDLDHWIKTILGSGKLAFYLSTMMFGISAMSIGWNMDAKKRGIIKLAFFYAACCVILVYVFEILNVEEEPLSISITCWLLLFSIGIWSEVEHYVTEYNVPMATQHFITMSAFNILASVGLIYIVFTYAKWPDIAKYASISIIVIALMSSRDLCVYYVSPTAKNRQSK